MPQELRILAEKLLEIFCNAVNLKNKEDLSVFWKSRAVKFSNIAQVAIQKIHLQ